MVKICQTRLLKLNFEIIPKNAFSGLCQKFLQAMHEVENFFFFQFPNPWTLRVSGMGGYTSKREKSQNHCTLLYIYILIHTGRGKGGEPTREKVRGAIVHKAGRKYQHD
jgi:hypothetical protein